MLSRMPQSETQSLGLGYIDIELAVGGRHVLTFFRDSNLVLGHFPLYSIEVQMFFGYCVYNVLVFTVFIPLHHFLSSLRYATLRPSQSVNGFLISSYTADQVYGFNVFLC